MGIAVLPLLLLLAPAQDPSEAAPPPPAPLDEDPADAPDEPDELKEPESEPEPADPKELQPAEPGRKPTAELPDPDPVGRPPPSSDEAPQATETDAIIAGLAAGGAAGAVAVGAGLMSAGFLGVGAMATTYTASPIGLLLGVAAAAGTWLFAAGLGAFAAGAVVLLLEDDLTEGGEWWQLGCVSAGAMAAAVIIPLSFFVGGVGCDPCGMALSCLSPNAQGQRMFGMNPLVTHPAAGGVVGAVVGGLAGGALGGLAGVGLVLAGTRGVDPTLAVLTGAAGGVFTGTVLGAVLGAGGGGTLGVLQARPQ